MLMDKRSDKLKSMNSLFPPPKKSEFIAVETWKVYGLKNRPGLKSLDANIGDVGASFTGLDKDALITKIENETRSHDYPKSPAKSRAHLFERGLYNGGISHGLYSENVFQMEGWGGLYMKHSIYLSINEGGLNMRVAYPMNFISRQK